MFKILIAPDSFKGSLSAANIAKILHNKLLESGFPIQLTSIPLADGGEGSLETIMYVREFEIIKINVLNPQLEEIEAYYLFDKQNNTAYIELAQASGLGLIKGKKDIINASTYGTGQLIRHAIENGASKLVIFLGGSASCDAGLGIADALGVQFFDQNHERILPSAEKMLEIKDFDLSSSILKDKKIEILLAVDVNNPFYGPNGASFIYSPQKGANPEQVKFLDNGLMNIAHIVEKQTGIDLQEIPGSGAAGGAAGGLVAFCGAKIIKGTDFIFDLIGLDEQIKQADLVISGEGKIDSQSLNNKLLYGISRLTAKYKKPFWAICGYFEGDSKLKRSLFIEKNFNLAKSKDEIDDSIRFGTLRMEKIAEEIIVELAKIIGK